MATALIGYTGFVGGNLRRQQSFDDYYNSKNIETIAGKHYHVLVSAGAPAAKWVANNNPEQDRQSIDRLCRNLATITAEKVVLISTVDVYPTPVEVDEDSPIDPEGLHPYGAHRLALERFLAMRFDTLIVRLPGLFGRGLKKNVIYDFLHDNNVDRINPRSVYQFYSLEHLTTDVRRALRHGLRLLNLATEPTSVAEVACVCLGHDFENAVSAPAARYDFRSRHAGLFDGWNGYLYRKEQVLADLEAYVWQQRPRHR